MIKIVGGAVVSTAIMFASISMAFAGEPYFVIKAENGSSSPFEVTDEVIAKVGTTSFETTLPGMDDGKHKVSGPLMRDLLKEANISGETALVVALDKYEAEVPVSDFQKFSVIAAVELDGKKLTIRDKGPAWIVYPRSDVQELNDATYESRSVWQIIDVTLK